VEPKPAPEVETTAPSEPPSAPEPPPETDRREETPPAQVRGRIDGPAVSRVAFVIVLGPDSLLREAARVRPDPDGSYRVGGLPPGRYAIQLDGGGKHVLVTEPRIRVLRITDDSAAVADFHVLRAL
jgi:hypothetical protein